MDLIRELEVLEDIEKVTAALIENSEAKLSWFKITLLRGLDFDNTNSAIALTKE